MSCISFIHYRIIHLLAYICLNHISEFKYIQLCHGSPQERLGLTRIPMEEVRSGHWNSNLVFHLYLIEMKWRHGYLTSKVAKVKPSWTSVGSDDPLNFFYPLPYYPLSLQAYSSFRKFNNLSEIESERFTLFKASVYCVSLLIDHLYKSFHLL